MTKRTFLLRGVVVALSFTGLGANCNPEPRACGYNDGVHECGFSASATPPTSVVPACLNFCAPVPTGDPTGAKCVVDPCETSLWMQANTYLCPPGWSCDPDVASPLSDFGQCVLNGQHFAAECDPGQRFETPCEGNTFCRAIDGCDELPPGIVTSGRDGVCYLYQHEGMECDGNWNQSGTCTPCTPGLKCVDRGDGDRCYRPCSNVDDCPCDTETTEFACGEDEFCNYCFANGVQCDETAECCDADATCDGDEVAGTSVCCHPEDASCDPGVVGQCCSGLACHPELAECKACIPLGRDYDEENPLGCCDPLVPREPLGGGDVECLPPCPDEPCAICNHNDNFFTDDEIDWTCSDEDPPECNVPALAPLGDTNLDDDCDGYDDDCDGMFDEGFDQGGSCTGALPGGFCSGMTDWPGTLDCTSDESGFNPSGGDTGEGWTCEHVAGVDFCATEYTSDPPVVDSAHMGMAPGSCSTASSNCMDDSDCSPDTYCGHWNGAMATTCITKHPSVFSSYMTDCGEMCWSPGDDDATLHSMCP